MRRRPPGGNPAHVRLPERLAFVKNEPDVRTGIFQIAEYQGLILAGDDTGRQRPPGKPLLAEIAFFHHALGPRRKIRVDLADERPCSRSGRRNRAAWAMAADAAASDGAAERAAAEIEGFVMKETSGERERAEPPGALSRPDRLKPVPAVLSLSSRRRLHGAPPRDARVVLARSMTKSTMPLQVLIRVFSTGRCTLKWEAQPKSGPALSAGQEYALY